MKTSAIGIYCHGETGFLPLDKEPVFILVHGNFLAYFLLQLSLLIVLNKLKLLITILKFQEYHLCLLPTSYCVLPINTGTRFEKALRIRMLIHILLGFKIISYWEALIISLYLFNKVKLLNEEKVSFAL